MHDHPHLDTTTAPDDPCTLFAHWYRAALDAVQDEPTAVALATVGADGRPAARMVLLNLWATWCPPCVRELPSLDRLAGRFAGEPFAVVTLALDQGGALQAAPFFERLGIVNLALYVDPARTIGEVLPDDVLPASFFLDREGRVVRYLRSYVDWDDPAADHLVRELLAQ